MGRGPKPAKGGAKPAVSRKSPKHEDARVRDLEKRLDEALKLQTEAQEQLQTRNRELAEAQEQRTATAEILRVISRSPTDAQPVFDTIARSAKQLCDSQVCAVFRFDGQHLHFVAHDGLTTEAVNANRRAYPAPADRGSAAGRAVLTGTMEQIPDVTSDPEYTFGAIARISTFRSIVAVPMLRDGVPIGAITVRRVQAGLFPDRQIDLLRTFADQAVIAIENVRLFTELQEKNRALTVAHAQATESLEQQTATAEILRVISSSPTDVQPTFDTIAKSARTLCDAAHGMVFRFDGQLIHLVAHDNLEPEQLDAVRGVFPIPPGRSSVTARAIMTGSVVHVRDRSDDPELDYSILSANFPTTLAVPLLRDGNPVGAITVTRAEARLFSEREIALLETFADQAVIAIENVRLFKELESRNSALTQALDRQTATAEILRVISSSPTDVQPVLDAVTRSAMQLCEAYDAWIGLREGDHLRVRAHHGPIPVAVELRPLRRGRVSETAILDRKIVHVSRPCCQRGGVPPGTRRCPEDRPSDHAGRAADA